MTVGQHTNSVHGGTFGRTGNQTDASAGMLSHRVGFDPVQSPLMDRADKIRVFNATGGVMTDPSSIETLGGIFNRQEGAVLSNVGQP